MTSDPELADRVTRPRDYALMIAVAIVLTLVAAAASGGVTPDASSEIVVVDGEGRSHIEHSAEDDRWSHCFAIPRVYWLEFSWCIMRQDEVLENGRSAPRPVFKPAIEVVR